MEDIKSESLYPRNEDIGKRTIKALKINRYPVHLVAGISVLSPIINSMKLYLILASIVLLLSSCKPSLIETSKDKIQIFERNEMKYFKGIHVRTLRNYKKQDPIEMEITVDSVFGNAIIQVHPDHIIYENFPTSRDSIELDLLATIDSLQVRGIHNSGDQTHLEFWYKDDYVYLFRRKPWLHQGAGEVTSVIGDWKFFTVKLRVDL